MAPGVRPDGVNVLLRDRQNRLLLQFRDGAAPAHPLQWDFFGGSMEKNESPEHCARRELAEELGIPAAAGELQEILALRIEGGMQYYFVYLPAIGWGDFRVLEGAGCAFFWPADLPQLARLENVKALAERMAAGTVGFPPQLE